MISLIVLICVVWLTANIFVPMFEIKSQLETANNFQDLQTKILQKDESEEEDEDKTSQSNKYSQFEGMDMKDIVDGMRALDK